MATITQPPSKWISCAAMTAKSSEHGIYKMGAVVVRGGNIVGIGWNKNRTHPKAKNYTRKIHAELAAIISAGKIQGTQDAEMYIARITNGGSIATSKPCKDCMILIKEAGIKSVTFIDEEGKIQCLKM